MLEDIPLDESNLEKYTRVGASMENKTKQDLVQFLKKSIDVFAWSHEDMPGIDHGVITHRLTKEVNFLVMDCSSSYNVIIGRPTLNSWKAVTSICHLSVKFPTKYEIGQVQGDQLAVRECYLAMLAMDEQVQTLSIEERRVVAEPTDVLEDIPLDESNLEKYTRVGASMERKTKQDLVQFLKKSIDVFAWSHEDIPGINPSVITHRLSVK